MSKTLSPTGEWMTVTDLVSRSGLSRMTVIREIERGNLQAHRQGSRRPYLVDPGEGERWLEATLTVRPVEPRKSDTP